jgi:hypothetical protein
MTMWESLERGRKTVLAMQMMKHKAVMAVVQVSTQGMGVDFVSDTGTFALAPGSDLPAYIGGCGVLRMLHDRELGRKTVPAMTAMTQMMAYKAARAAAQVRE